MYVILVYDMEADRTQKMLRLGRRYLVHVQNSVLEGEITKGDLAELRGKIEDLLITGESVVIYELSTESYLDRTVYGEDPKADDQFL